MIKTVQISEKEAWDLAFNALVNNKTSEDNAKEVADALISASATSFALSLDVLLLTRALNAKSQASFSEI